MPRWGQQSRDFTGCPCTNHGSTVKLTVSISPIKLQIWAGICNSVMHADCMDDGRLGVSLLIVVLQLRLLSQSS